MRAVLLHCSSIGAACAASMALVIGCGGAGLPGPGSGTAAAGGGEVGGEDEYLVILESKAVRCVPFAGWEALETPAGELAEGIEVCAEFLDACECTTATTSRRGVAEVHATVGAGPSGDAGAGTVAGEDPARCWSWSLLESEFWSYAEGRMCAGTTGDWLLDGKMPDGSRCSVTIPPQPVDGVMETAEFVCERTEDGGMLVVVDRLLLRRLHGSGGQPWP